MISGKLESAFLYSRQYFSRNIQVGPYTFRKKHTHLIFQALTEYDYCGITKDSVVLDLGASVGGFTVHAAKRCKHIYAVEPVFTKLLEENLALNNITNCTVLPYAVGNLEGSGNVIFGNYRGIATYYTFAGLLSVIPDKIDFMKCDIEGDEKYVDFNLIPNIEAEIHDESGLRMYHKRNWVEI